MKLKGKRIQNLRQSDFVIIAMVTILVIFGVVMVFSASYYNRSILPVRLTTT